MWRVACGFAVLAGMTSYAKVAIAAPRVDRTAEIAGAPFPASTEHVTGEGFYTVSHTNSIGIHWTNGVVGMTLLIRGDSLAMTGTAEARTD